MDAFDIKTINELNVDKLQEGTKKVELNIILPENIKLVQQYTVDVKITKNPL